MFWISRQISAAVPQPQLLRNRLWNAIQTFWTFSEFYGDYQSLSPSQRRKFVVEKTRQRSLSDPHQG